MVTLFELLESPIFRQFSVKNRPLRYINLCVMWTFALLSAACSSGQEASSIAVANLNFKKHQSNSFCAGVKIMGTNISE